MTKLLRANIFEVSPNADLLLVFGHKGFAEISATWDRHSKRYPEAAALEDPWSLQEPVKIGSQWVWFSPDSESGERGLSAANITSTLFRCAEWVQSRGLRSIITNGSRSRNEHHADVRAGLLICLSLELEVAFDVDISLVSLDDVFVRNSHFLSARKGPPPPSVAQ